MLSLACQSLSGVRVGTLSSTTAVPVAPARLRAPVARFLIRGDATHVDDSEMLLVASRRSLMLGTAMLPLVGGTAPAKAQENGYKTYLGYSQAPDLYLGYGQAQDAAARYTFEYPADWEEEIPTKTEKSTMGMDGRVIHPRTRKEMAYVIALGGKDYRDSVLKDAKTSLIVIAGGDPDMRQALSDGVVQQAEKRINGTDMYVYDVRSDKRHYLSTIGKKGDTVFALVVTAPTGAFEKDATGLRHIQDTFKLL